MDATLPELLLTLRSLSSPSPSFFQQSTTRGASTQDGQILHSHLAKYTFRAIYPDPSAGGRFESRELGVVFSKDLCEPSVLTESYEPSLEAKTKGDSENKEEEMEMKDEAAKVESMETAEQPVLTRPPKDTSPPPGDSNANQNTTEAKENAKSSRENRTLYDLRFRQGDYLSVSVVLPPQPGSGGVGGEKSGGAPGGSIGIRGSAPGGDRNRFGRDEPRQIPWVTSPTTTGPTSRGGFGGGGIRRGRGGASSGAVGDIGSGAGRGLDRNGPTNGRRDRDVPPPRDDRHGDRERRASLRAGGREETNRRSGNRRSRSRSPSRSRNNARQRSRSRDHSMASSRSHRRSRSRSRSRSRVRSRSPVRRAGRYD
ncbi:hypothetical protein FRB91_000651 [Serendipita sp. 411]|nr:hypothetical protein FRB91_000651 [Serendipita sp. 411]